MIMDYLKVLDNDPVYVTLNDTQYEVKKSSVYKFFKLQEILKSNDEEKMLLYVACSLGVELEVASHWFFVDVVNAFNVIIKHNEPLKIHLDTMKGATNNYYEYKNRALALIVTRLASAFHWSEEFILHGLTYERAKCYLQELIIEEHKQQEFQYALSEIGFDKRGKKQPFSKLPFSPFLEDEEEKPKIVRIPSKAMPEGVVTVLNEQSN